MRGIGEEGSCGGGGGGAGCCGYLGCCTAVELFPVMSLTEARVWSRPTADTGGVLNDTVRVEKAIEFKICVQLIEPSVVFTSSSQGAEVLAVQLRLDIVTEADKGCPVTVTGKRLTTAADTSTRETSVTSSDVLAAGEEEAGEREDLCCRTVPGEV